MVPLQTHSTGWHQPVNPGCEFLPADPDKSGKGHYYNNRFVQFSSKYYLRAPSMTTSGSGQRPAVDPGLEGVAKAPERQDGLGRVAPGGNIEADPQDADALRARWLAEVRAAYDREGFSLEEAARAVAPAVEAYCHQLF